MTEVAKRSGAELQWLDGVEGEPVSLGFKGLPIAKAMERILRPRSFLLFWSRDSGGLRLSRVIVMSTSDGAPISHYATSFVADSASHRYFGAPDAYGSRLDSAMRSATAVGGVVDRDSGRELGARARRGTGGDGGLGVDGDPELDHDASDSDEVDASNSSGAVAVGRAVATASPAPTRTPSAAKTCAPLPRATCRGSAESRGGQLAIRRKPDGAGLLTWKWTKGRATTKAEFGDPRRSTSYTLCIYDEKQRLIMQAKSEAGGRCDGKSCWTETDTGFKYRDATLDEAGMVTLALTAGRDAKAKIVLEHRVASGERLSPPVTSVPATVQLTNSEGRCWQSTYGSAGTNQPRRFSVKAD